MVDASADFDSALDTAITEGTAALQRAEDAIDLAMDDMQVALQDIEVGLQQQVDDIVATTADGIAEVRAAGTASLQAWADHAVAQLQLEGESREQVIRDLATERRLGIYSLRSQLYAEVVDLASLLPATLDRVLSDEAAVFDAVWEIEQAAARLEIGEDDSQERDELNIDATRILADELDALPPELRARVMREVEGAVGAMTDNLDHLDGDETAAALANLTRAGESLGRDDIALLTDVVAAHLPGTLDEHFSNMGELSRGVEAAIADGHGALFGAALTDALHDQGELDLAGYMAGATETGIDRVVSEYEDALADFEDLEGQLANWVLNNGPLVQEEGIEAAQQAFRDEHAATYDRFLAMQEQYGKLLPGVSYAADEWTENADLVVYLDDPDLRQPDVVDPYTGESHPVPVRSREVGAEDSAVDRALFNVTSLNQGLQRDEDGEWVQADVGREILVRGMLNEAEGHRTFLSSAADRSDAFVARENREAGLEDGKDLVYGWDERMTQTLDSALVDATQASLGDRDGDGTARPRHRRMANALEAWGRLQGGVSGEDLDYAEMGAQAAAELRAARDTIVERGLGDAAALELLTSTSRNFFNHPDLDIGEGRQAGLGALSDTLAIVTGVSAWGTDSNLERAATGAAGLNVVGRLAAMSHNRQAAALGVSDHPALNGRIGDGISVLGGAIDVAVGLEGLLSDPDYKSAFDTAIGTSATLQAFNSFRGNAALASKFANASVLLAAGCPSPRPPSSSPRATSKRASSPRCRRWGRASGSSSAASARPWASPSGRARSCSRRSCSWATTPRSATKRRR